MPIEPPRPAPGRAAAVALLAAVVMGIVAVAFRGSWGALRDAALSAHFDRASADLYPFAVDGLLIVAVIAAVLLRHDRGARRYTLSIIGGYTVASWLINFLHGLGMFLPNPATGHRPVPPWPVVVVIASLVIGSIFLGSHLLVFVWRHLLPEPAVAAEPEPVERPGTGPERDDTDAPEQPAPPTDTLDAAKIAYRESLAPGRQRLSQKVLADQFRISRREAAQVQHEVSSQVSGEHEATEALDADDVLPQYTWNGAVPAPAGGGA